MELAFLLTKINRTWKEIKLRKNETKFKTFSEKNNRDPHKRLNYVHRLLIKKMGNLIHFCSARKYCRAHFCKARQRKRLFTECSLVVNSKQVKLPTKKFELCYPYFKCQITIDNAPLDLNNMLKNSRRRISRENGLENIIAMWRTAHCSDHWKMGRNFAVCD